MIKRYAGMVLGYGGMVALSLFMYGHVLEGPFLFDDRSYISRNINIYDLGRLKTLWRALHVPARFIGFLSFSLNYHWHQLNVYGYHVVNLCIHLVTAILLCWVTRLTATTPRLRFTHWGRQRELLAFCVALVFLVHPLQTQAVSYLTQRFASLATLFYMAALYFYVKGRLVFLNTTHSNLTRGKRFVGAGLFFAAALSGGCAMFTKQIAFTLPLMILLYEVYFFKTHRGFKINWPQLGAILPFLLIIPSFFKFNLLRILSLATPSGSHAGDYLTSPTYFLTQWRVILTYLRLFWIPLGQRLDYDYAMSATVFDPRAVVSGVVLGALFYGILKLKPRYPVVAFGLSWFFLALAVESSVIVIRHVIFEHRLYLPSVGLSLMMVAGLRVLLQRPRHFYTAMGIIVMTFSILTWQRNHIWRDAVVFWTDAVRKAPKKPRGYHNLGMALREQGDYQGAIQSYGRALALDPTFAKSFNNRGVIFLLQAQWDEAVPDFNRAIALNPRYDEALNNRGVLYRQIGLRQEALADYNQAIALNPRNMNALNDRGVFYNEEGAYALALADFNQALRRNRFHAGVYFNRGNTHLAQKNYPLAIADYTRAIQQDNWEADYYCNRGTAHRLSQSFEAALQDYAQAITLNPYHQKAYENRGELYAALGQPEAAQAAYERAVAIDPRTLTAQIRLTAWYWRSAQPAKARAQLNQILTMKGARTNPHVKILQRIMAYEKK